jgi:hypothetical protein
MLAELNAAKQLRWVPNATRTWSRELECEHLRREEAAYMIYPINLAIVPHLLRSL